MKIKSLVQQSFPVLIAMASFTLMILGAMGYAGQKKDRWEKDVKSRIFEQLMTKKTRLEKALYSRIYYTKSVAAYVSLKPNITTLEYYNLADELIQNDSVICTMSLSENCIIGAVFPLKGHEAAIGLNLLEHPERNEIVQKTILTREPFIAGPVELVEGGVAFISYTPIFDKTIDQGGVFWGVTDIVIYKDRLLEQASLSETENGFSFALRGFNGTGNTGKAWWGDDDVFNQNPVTVSIDLPYGTWVLAAVPVIGWQSYLNQDQVLFSLLMSSAFIISVLIWLLSSSVLKIRRNSQELKAIFLSMDSLIVEFDQDGRYVKVPPLNTSLLYRPKEELLNKTLYEVFPEETARQFHESILECLRRKENKTMEYPLEINGQERWFSATISWKSDQRVIFHAHDVTEHKMAMEKILTSEKRLRELNATKDKFFSIIAHDLKSPFNSILGHSNLLNTDYEAYTEAERRKAIAEIDVSARNAYELLENLLLWAISQSGKISLDKESFSFAGLVDEAIQPYMEGARKKLLDVVVDIPGDIKVTADKFTIRTVVANLFNNAIKFTPEQGKVHIRADRKESLVLFEITDTGIGIAEEIIPKLFRIEESISTRGTAGEKGTGLGLLLCKEFVTKHDGKIWVESKLGKGSTFGFSLPVNED
ncbi:MAG: CHASE domain-containing protein [Bacteroidales bacterium]|nr:CHASE domain-containing protein [Bacteroidales bacterium]